jgi:hypothetical protein
MINQALAVTKTKKFKYINTIDFDVAISSKEVLENKQNAATTGVFFCNGHTQRISLGDLNYMCNTADLSMLNLPEDITRTETDYVHDTLLRSRNVFWKKYAYGI